jgi:bis(5'-nucleosidyl)-tetraphosphatase
MNDANFDERSAGGIVYKPDYKKIYWLVVRTESRYKNKKGENKIRAVYKFPKGHMQNGEFLKQTALREVEEEGRIKARIIAKLRSNDYIFWDRVNGKKITKKVTFFLMEYVADSNLKHYDTEMVTEREWLVYEEALEKLAYDSEKTLLRKAKERLEEG